MILRQANSGAIVRGTTDGDALLWDAGAGEWLPGAVARSASKFNASHFITGPEVDFIGTGAPVVQPILTLPPFTLVGNALVIAYKAQCNLQLPIGVSGDFLLDVLLDTLAIPAMQSRFADLNEPATPEANFVSTLTLPGLVLTGLTPGATVALVLQGTWTGDAGPPAAELDVLTDGLWLQAQDWTL